MRTLTKPLKPIAAQQLVYRCANSEHWSVASASERMRIHDHRWQDPPGRIPEHDYCPRECKTTHTLAVRGRPAFCPLGDVVEDHEWIAVNGGAFRRIGW